jgi:OOP family OmpA-OmpF porin
MDITYLDYLFKNSPPLGTDNPLIETDFNARAKLLPDNYLLTPYVSAGIGISKYTSYWGLYMPLGLGLQISLGPADVYFFSNFQYRLPITSNTNNHFNYSIGFGAPLSGKKDEKSTFSSPF